MFLAISADGFFLIFGVRVISQSSTRLVSPAVGQGIPDRNIVFFSVSEGVGFAYKLQQDKESDHHENGRKEKSEKLIISDIGQDAANEEGQNGADPAHHVDDTVGLAAQGSGSYVRHERDDRAAPQGHDQIENNDGSHKGPEALLQRGQREKQGADGNSENDPGQAPADTSAGFVTGCTDQGLKNNAEEVIDRHDRAD